MDDFPNESLETVLDSLAVRRVRDLLGDREDAVVSVGDEEGDLRWASTPGTNGLFGRTLEDFRGHNRFDYVHPDDVAAARRQHDLALQGETVRYTIRVRTADDTWRRVTSVAWGIDAPWGRAVVTITTADEPLSWPDGGQR